MPNVYVTKFFDPEVKENKETKKIKVSGSKYTVRFNVDKSWYGEVRISEIPAAKPVDAIEKASGMLDRVLPGVDITDVAYEQE